MINENQRWIYFYDKFLKSYPEDAPYFEMREIMKELHDRQQQGNSVKLINNETAAIRINDMHFDDTNSTVCLLIQYADKTISDPVFSNLQTGDIRVEPKLDGEGVAISAHILVSLTPNDDGGNTYITLVEDVPGIGKTKIEPFLTSEFKKVSEGYVFSDEQERERSCRPMVEMSAYPSQSLKEDMERGILQGLELVRNTHINGEFDEPDYTKTDSHIVKIKVTRPVNGEEAVGLINRIKQKARRLNYSELRVRYKRREGKQRTVPISTAREDAGDAMYARYEIIRVNEPLPQCSSTIRDDVHTKMTSLLVDARDRI